MEKYGVPIQMPVDGRCPGCGATLISDDGSPRCPTHGTEYLEVKNTGEGWGMRESETCCVPIAAGQESLPLDEEK